jgi:hypothetical protein
MVIDERYLGSLRDRFFVNQDVSAMQVTVAASSTVQFGDLIPYLP